MSAGAPDVGKTRRHAPLLQVVRPQPDRRAGSLEDRSPKPERVCNRVPDNVRGEIVQLALDEPELSPRELAARFTDTKSYFVSEASVYRMLKDSGPFISHSSSGGSAGSFCSNVSEGRSERLLWSEERV
jgi:hypothetical protein